MTVAWNSDSVANPSFVEYGRTPAFGDTAQGSVAGVPGGLRAHHEVDLEGLDPGAMYYYRVGGEGDWSNTFTFNTAPEEPCAPFSFVAMGDGRSDDGFGPSRRWSSILSEAFAHDPAFIVNTGDLVKDGAEVDQWENLLVASDDAHPFTPHMPCIGNHDDDKTEGEGALYNQLFAIPRNSETGTEDFYYFLYSNLIVVSLSTQTFMGGDSQFQIQADWLDRVLTEHPKTWKVVFFHHPPYTGSAFGATHPPNEKDQNAALVPIFDKHHVDIVLSGHNHWYQRFEPMCCGGGQDSGRIVGSYDQGTLYVITGGAGSITLEIPFIESTLPALLCMEPGSLVCSGKHHYMLFKVDGTELHAEVWATAAQNFDVNQGNIEIIDEFTIRKPGAAEDCVAVTVPDASDSPDEGSDTQSSDSGTPPATTDPGTTEPEPDEGSTPTEERDPGPSGTPADEDAKEAEADTSISGGFGVEEGDTGCSSTSTGHGTPFAAAGLLLLLGSVLRRRRR